MKRIVISAMIVSAALLSCTKREPAYEKFVVTAKGGLNMRINPSSKSERITLIPEGSTVLLLEKTSEKETIDGQEGTWAKTQWGDRTGYVFDRFLKPINSNQLQTKCPTFMLYNIVCFPQEEVNKLASKYLKADSPYPVELTLDNFETLPSLLPGSEVIVLTTNAKAIEKVKSLSIYQDMASRQTLLLFTLGKAYPKAIYISRDHIKQDGGKEPEIITLSETLDSSRMEKRLHAIIFKREIQISFDEFTKDPAIVREHYFLRFYDAQHPDLKEKLEIFLLHNKQKESNYNYIAVFINERLAFDDYGYLNTVFSYRSKPHVALTRYIPHSGNVSTYIYMIENRELKEIQMDDRFSN